MQLLATDEQWDWLLETFEEYRDHLETTDNIRLAAIRARLARYETARPFDPADGSGDFGDAFPGYRWLATVGEPVLDERPGVSERLRLVEVVVTAAGFGSLSYRIRRCLYVPE